MELVRSFIFYRQQVRLGVLMGHLLYGFLITSNYYWLTPNSSYATELAALMPKTKLSFSEPILSQNIGKRTINMVVIIIVLFCLCILTTLFILKPDWSQMYCIDIFCRLRKCQSLPLVAPSSSTLLNRFWRKERWTKHCWRIIVLCLSYLKFLSLWTRMFWLSCE